MRRYDLAVGKLRETLEMEPNFLHAHVALGIVYDASGDYSEMVAELRKARRLGETAVTAAFLARAYAASGGKATALAIRDDCAGSYMKLTSRPIASRCFTRHSMSRTRRSAGLKELTKNATNGSDG